MSNVRTYVYTNLTICSGHLKLAYFVRYPDNMYVCTYVCMLVLGNVHRQQLISSHKLQKAKCWPVNRYALQYVQGPSHLYCQVENPELKKVFFVFNRSSTLWTKFSLKDYVIRTYNWIYTIRTYAHRRILYIILLLRIHKPK